MVLFFLLVACQAAPDPTPTRQNLLAAPMNPAALAAQIPALATRRADVAAALQANPPVLTLAGLQGEAAQAQTLALQHAEFLAYAIDSTTGQPVRTEIMAVRPSLPSDQPAAAVCTPDHCYRVELYNYALNTTTVALVDTAAGQVISVSHLDNAQPEIPPALADLAVQIARQSPEVVAALGGVEGTAVMPNVKTALNGTLCERSQHLCVAPTFLLGEQALWAIVDLTDERLVGIRWTDLGLSGTPAAVTERSLQNEIVYESYCKQSQTLTQGDWTMEFILTGSDGLKLSNVSYQGQPVLHSATLVDWHVSYSRQDGFGYNDAIGCPIFSAATVLAFNGPSVEEIVENGTAVGFALVQDFRSPDWPTPCNYRYEQRYEFYADGRFRVLAANHGRGCGDDGTYRPVLRLDVAGSSDGTADTFAAWDGQNWQPWAGEGWQVVNEATPTTSDGYPFQLTGTDGRGFTIQPIRSERGDPAYLYLTRTGPDYDEGKTDLPSLGSCCNTDYQQGPEQFITPSEPAAAQDLVLWFVPELQNDATPGQEYCWADSVIENGVPVARSWPCYAGLFFTPVP
ncbi:MAG TPA: hypothetical protein PLD25_04500 [Chloroflexota bacterium]|nr:hypothetical protein [Chloroflexota bacterium]